MNCVLQVENYYRNDDSSKPQTDTWRIRMSQRAMSIDNISFLSPPISKPLHNSSYNMIDSKPDEIDDDKEMIDSDVIISKSNGQTEFNDNNNEEDENIIPWKKLLRKTNSRLNLIS